VIEGETDPTSEHSIAGLVHCRSLGNRWQVTVAGASEETVSAIESLPVHVERVDVSFEDAVLAYLSRSRVGHSFYTGAAS